MIRCLFIGGCKHSQVLEVSGSCTSGPDLLHIEVADNLTPWEEEQLRAIVSEMPPRGPSPRTHRYRAMALNLGIWKSAWVYVLVGINQKDLENAHLAEPGIMEKIMRTAF